VEGISDRNEAVPFTRSRGARSRRPFDFPTRANPRTKDGDARRRRSSHEGGRGGKQRRVRDRDVRGSIAHGAVGRKRPRCCIQAERRKVHSACVVRRSAEAVLGRRETPRPPVFHRAEPETPRGVPVAQATQGAGNARGAGARDSIGWQKSVRRIARLHCRTVARSVGRTRALAGSKFVAPPDAGHGWIDGETVRLYVGIRKRPRARLCRFRLASSNTTEDGLGLLPGMPSPAGRRGALRLLGQGAQ